MRALGIILFLLSGALSQKQVTCTSGDCKNTESGVDYSCSNNIGDCDCGNAQSCSCNNNIGDCNCGDAQTCYCDNVGGDCNCGKASTCNCQNSGGDCCATPTASVTTAYSSMKVTKSKTGCYSSLSSGAIVGIVFGVLIGSACIAFCCLARYRSVQAQKQVNNRVAVAAAANSGYVGVEPPKQPAPAGMPMGVQQGMPVQGGGMIPAGVPMGGPVAGGMGSAPMGMPMGGPVGAPMMGGPVGPPMMGGPVGPPGGPMMGGPGGPPVMGYAPVGGAPYGYNPQYGGYGAPPYGDSPPSYEASGSTLCPSCKASNPLGAIKCVSCEGRL